MHPLTRAMENNVNSFLTPPHRKIPIYMGDHEYREELLEEDENDSDRYNFHRRFIGNVPHSDSLPPVFTNCSDVCGQSRRMKLFARW